MSDSGFYITIGILTAAALFLIWYFTADHYRDPLKKDPVNHHILVNPASGISTRDLKRGTDGGTAFEEEKGETTVIAGSRRKLCDIEFKNEGTYEVLKATFAEALKVGRAPAKDASGCVTLVISGDPGISREHFILTLDNGRILIRDLNSRNQTHINGKITDGSAELHNGDVIEMGHTKLKVTFSIH